MTQTSCGELAVATFGRITTSPSSRNELRNVVSAERLFPMSYSNRMAQSSRTSERKLPLISRASVQSVSVLSVHERLTKMFPLPVAKSTSM